LASNEFLKKPVSGKTLHRPHRPQLLTPSRAMVRLGNYYGPSRATLVHTTRCRILPDTGFFRNSLTPSREASITRQRSTWAVSMIIGTSGNREHTGRTHDAHQLSAVEQRHFPVEDDEIGREHANRLEAGDAVGRLVKSLEEKKS